MLHADIRDVVISQLRQQGYEDIRIGRTFLGRTRIIARSATVRREIILNPRTGEILRDYWERVGDASGDGGHILDNGPSGNGVSGEDSENHDNGHDDDDDGDDDDDD